MLVVGGWMRRGRGEKAKGAKGWRPTFEWKRLKDREERRHAETRREEKRRQVKGVVGDGAEEEGRRVRDGERWCMQEWIVALLSARTRPC